MKHYFIALFITILIFCTHGKTQDLGKRYIEAWKDFYPTKALAKGFHASIFSFENFSEERIQNWLMKNKSMLKNLSDSNHLYVQTKSIDARLLSIQARKEIGIWGEQNPIENNLFFTATHIRNATRKVLESDFLEEKEKMQILCGRFVKVEELSERAKESFGGDDRENIEKGLRILKNEAEFYQNELSNRISENQQEIACLNLKEACERVSRSIQSLIKHVETKLLPKAGPSTLAIGREEYARQLSLYTDSQVTPEKLGAMALDEIEWVRKEIGRLSKKYLESRDPGVDVSGDEGKIIQMAFRAMENDAPTSGPEYLAFWKELAQGAKNFLSDHDIATLPEFSTLRIANAPESAGPAARIGWVASAPPFAPNPVTTLYLPSIPDTLPLQEQIDFWSSFNKPFNRMIVIHELYPGHYMQMKISRESPHPVRLLFPYEPYIEGWATFTERVVLDAGWEKDDPLTFLAHLRKRIENANRAYLSVQVHCNNWTEEQVMDFSIHSSLLAPQFAKSLWGRLTRSPMQMTSYFYGGKLISELFDQEKRRLGTSFDLKRFMDTLLRSGPIPIDEYPAMFE